MSKVNSDYYPYWQDVTSYPNTLKRAKTFMDAYPTVQPDTMIDKSIFQNTCRNDMLSVSHTVGIHHDLNDNWSFVGESDKAQYPEKTNYFFIYSAWNVYNTRSPQELVESRIQSRIGMEVTQSSTLPDVSPIIEMATTYFCSLVQVMYADLDSITTPSGLSGIPQLNISNVQTAPYDAVKNLIDNDPNWFDDHVVLEMWLDSYYGTATRRTTSDGIDDPLGLGCYRGVWQNISDLDYMYKAAWEEYDYELLLPAIDMVSGISDQKKNLKQGGNIQISLQNDRSAVIFARANPSYWKIASREQTSRDIIIQAYIDSPIQFMSAYNAYRATGQHFTGDVILANSGDVDNMDRGDTDENGNTDGEASVTPEHIRANLNDDPEDFGNADFDPDAPDEDVDPNTYTDEVSLSHPAFTPVNIFNKTYAMNATQLRSLADYLWNSDDDIYGEVYDGLKLFGQCPMDGIIDIRMYPFDVLSMLYTSSGEFIKIGRTVTDTYGRRVTGVQTAVIDLGSCTFFKKFKNFLDYSPHTQARLYLPYCGIVAIDTTEFMGRTITAKMIVDVVTGACTCVVFADGFPVAESHGSCGIGIAVSGSDSAKYTASVLSNFVGGVSSIASSAVSVGVGGMSNIVPAQTTASSGVMRQRMADYKHDVTANAASAGGGVVGGLSQIWEAYTTPVQYMSAGAATPATSTWLPQKAYFLIDRPVQLERSGYGHTVGYACMIFGTLSSFSGFTVCSNVDTSGFAQATETERAELKALLETGVFL